ncbi:MAG: hypothetical protein WDM80_06200 [Limisphaerales bacterium]
MTWEQAINETMAGRMKIEPRWLPHCTRAAPLLDCSVADIVLTTLNAKYIHAAFGLRYLMANLGDLRPTAVLAEFDINQRPLDIAEMLLAREPKIIGFGVYIWNVVQTMEVITAIKRFPPKSKSSSAPRGQLRNRRPAHSPARRSCH